MNPWICALYISIAGGAGGWVNAHMNNRGFIKPRCIDGVWCPGAIPTVLIGAFAAWASWAFYGSGIGIDLADAAARPHLQMPALAGAFLVGVVGGKWITNETDKRFLRAGVNEAAKKDVPKETAEKLEKCDPIEVYRRLKAVSVPGIAQN